jgi:hypothetical protein
MSRLSRSSVHSGTFFVPSFVNQHAEGEWDIVLSTTARVGKAEVKQGIAAGFRAAFQLLGADAGDYCLLRFDLAKNEVAVEIGDSDLEDRTSRDDPETEVDDPSESDEDFDAYG